MDHNTFLALVNSGVGWVAIFLGLRAWLGRADIAAWLALAFVALLSSIYATTPRVIVNNHQPAAATTAVEDWP